MPLAGLEAVSFAYGLNHYAVDVPYRRLLRYWLGGEPELSRLGELAGREVYEVAYRVDLLDRPVLVQWSPLGDNPDVALLDPLERELIRRLVVELGVNRPPFEGGSWHEHYAATYLVGDAGLACVLTITVQTAYALYKYGDERVRHLYRNLVGASEPLMLGATWFTEVQGGSDLGANATKAVSAGDGTWRLTGYKYFASGAGIADLALVTARPEGAPAGPKGLALFLVPRRRRDGSLNYRVRRLKWKVGTAAVPTGEVELADSEAYLVGDTRYGIYYVLEDLMVSRLANSMGALGIARKAYLEAYGFAVTRRAFGRRIIEHPLLARDLLEAELRIEAGLALAMKAVSLFDRAWHDRPPYGPAYNYARLLTHVAKNYTAEVAASVTSVAMEVFGGIGFLHEFPVERWHREALVTPIWEGTSNVQALDMLEALVRKGAHEPLLDDVEELARSQQESGLAEAAERLVRRSVDRALRGGAEAVWEAKSILRGIAVGVAVLQLLDAARATGDAVFEHVAEMVYQLEAGGELRQPEPGLLREVLSLRGGLEGVDWGARMRV